MFLYSKFVFSGHTKMAVLVVLSKGDTVYSGARYVALWASCLDLVIFANFNAVSVDFYSAKCIICIYFV